jgi:hypothetical protein
MMWVFNPGSGGIRIFLPIPNPGSKRQHREIIWSKLLCWCSGEIFKLLEHEEKYLVSFKRSVGYLKLLAELDLLKVIYAEKTSFVKGTQA